MMPQNTEWSNKNLDDRWAIYIDIEGFSNLWNSNPGALRGLHDLMDAIFKIGTSDPFRDRRLFAHHIGDAFFIASEFGERSHAMPIGVATVIMKYLVSRGFFAKASISSGCLGDYVTQQLFERASSAVAAAPWAKA
jgi:hypothetical protein